ncbi:MAG TPA: alpha/beta hydrolase [Verrucomicrobiae bacterium]|nr:alpha/beta hydrolase [Verrucomicrobiae bacterium]
MKAFFVARSFFLAWCIGANALWVSSADSFTRTEDVIYGRKFGVALTMDVFQPPEPNKAAVLFMVSGGFFSAKEAINPKMYKPFLDHGYTVFAIVHGSQPKFIIPEITQDIHRAIRFIRHNASKYGVDPQKFGISGASAGGHLSLTMGTQGKKGSPDAKDPIDRESSEVQAVACLFPPTDFLNYGADGVDAVGVGILAAFKAAFGPRAESTESRAVYGKEISPLNFLSREAPPTLIIHGDADKLVPFQQSELFVNKAKELGVKAELIRREGKDHGWPGIEQDVEVLALWFDQHLLGKKESLRP